MDVIKAIEYEQLKNAIPEIKVGNTVRVHVRIKEGNKERIQVFEGIVIKKQGGTQHEAESFKQWRTGFCSSR